MTVPQDPWPDGDERLESLIAHGNTDRANRWTVAHREQALGRLIASVARQTGLNPDALLDAIHDVLLYR